MSVNTKMPKITWKCSERMSICPICSTLLKTCRQALAWLIFHFLNGSIRSSDLRSLIRSLSKTTTTRRAIYNSLHCWHSCLYLFVGMFESLKFEIEFDIMETSAWTHPQCQCSKRRSIRTWHVTQGTRAKSAGESKFRPLQRLTAYLCDSGTFLFLLLNYASLGTSLRLG